MLIFKNYFTRALFLGLTSLTLVAQAADHNMVNATLVYGIDTNPNELNSNLSPASETFYAAELSFDAEFFDLLYVDAKANKSLYPDDRRADKYSLDVNLGLKSDFIVTEQQFEWEVSLQHRRIDQTFVSKANGFAAAFNGISIADRYDNTDFDYLVGLDWVIYRTLTIGFDYQSRKKTYFDLLVPGLPNLNYKQSEFLLGLEYLSSDQGYMFMKTGVKKRRFEDRVNRDLLGLPLIGTNLEYDYYSVDVGYVYHPEDGIEWRYTYNYAHRFDNGSGYYEATSGYMSMMGTYKVTDRQFLTAELIYSKLSYENRVADGDINDLPEEAEEAAGGRFKIGYEWVVSRSFGTNFAIYLEAQHSLSVNRNSIYTFNRSFAAAGFRWSAF